MQTSLTRKRETDSPQSPSAHMPDFQWPDKVKLLGMDVSCVDYQQATDAIFSAVSHNQPGLVSCHAVHAVVTLTATSELCDMMNQFQMVTPDGQPVRWAMNWLHGTRLRDRVYGPELMLRVCQIAADERVPIYLYGGNEFVSKRLAVKLRERFPDLLVAGAEAPPFRPISEAEDREVADRINQSGAKIVFVGLGCPKQDLFAFRQRNAINGVTICVGAAFDFHAGVKSMAPAWMQASGLEWLYRLWQEPRRLTWRYLVTSTVFLARFAKQWLRN